MDTLLDLVKRQPVPQPWAEADNLPWNEPGFSERMLREHLSQEHDAASRRFATIDRHVAWIHDHLLGGKASQILDLGCGPGLYASRLARLGHTCHGIDFSPASIRYAQEQALHEQLACTYLEADLRQADFGAGYDLVMQIFGEFNVFPRAVASQLLRKAHAALRPGGQLLLEVHAYETVQRIGRAAPSWYNSPGGLFSPEPHLVLEESFWDEGGQAATTRYHVLEAASSRVSSYAASYQAYTDPEYAALLQENGFAAPRFYPALASGGAEPRQDLVALLAAA